ncbi:M48 family metallopeptidase [soil metagenome]
MRRRSFMALSGASLVCGCSGAVHRMPAISQGNLVLAQSEVRSAGGAPQRRSASDEEVVAILQAASRRIVSPALQTCHEMGVGVCDWKFRISPSRALDAGAYPAGFIVVNRGVVEYAANEEEVCLVIAHEIGHQAANHVVAGMRNQMIGAMIGATLLGVAAAAAMGGRYGSTATTRQAIQTGAQLGGQVGHLSFSKEQEREADYLAALILYRSGVDLDKARGMLVTLARFSGQQETGLLDTHPAGPERVAGWDRAVAEIRASDGGLPKRT